MSTLEIEEIQNKRIGEIKPIKEIQDIFIPDIDPEMNIPNRNGFIYCVIGPPGSGKSSLALNMMKNKDMYRQKFDNIYYFCPEESFISVDNHPFQDHDKTYHELSAKTLDQVYDKCVSIRKERLEAHKDEENKLLINWKKKEIRDLESDELLTGVKINWKKGKVYDLETKELLCTIEKPRIQYNCVFIDDFADILKDKEIEQQLKKMLIKSRHLCCAFIFALQTYLYFPKNLRKQISNVSIFQPNNTEEFVSLSKELFTMKASQALDMFNYCFDIPYAHLDVDTRKSLYYKNFNLLKLKFLK